MTVFPPKVVWPCRPVYHVESCGCVSTMGSSIHVGPFGRVEPCGCVGSFSLVGPCGCVGPFGPVAVFPP